MNFSLGKSAVFSCFGTLCLLVSGCGDDRAVIWQAHVKSPDGHYQVNAATTQQSGPGNAALYTEVKLSQRDDEAGFDILDISHEDDRELIGGPVTVTWVDNTTLRLEYNSVSRVDFQAIKSAGVEVRSLPRPQ